MNQILVRHGKGGKDRVTVLPASVREPLRMQLKKARAVHENDGAGASRAQGRFHDDDLHSRLEQGRAGRAEPDGLSLLLVVVKERWAKSVSQKNDYMVGNSKSLLNINQMPGKYQPFSRLWQTALMSSIPYCLAEAFLRFSRTGSRSKIRNVWRPVSIAKSQTKVTPSS